MKFRNLLQQADYTLVLPMEDVQPLSLILKKEKNIFSWLKQREGSLVNASLADLFVTQGRGATYPKISEQELPKKLMGSDLVDADSNFVTSFLIKSQLKASANLKKSKKMLFSFENAKELSVNQIIVDEYLLSAKLNVNSPTFSEAVRQERIYIITSALTSKVLNLRNADDFNLSGNINAKALADYVNASANTSYSNSETYNIKSEGDTPLTFAIKAVRILNYKNQYRIRPEKITVRKTENEVEYFNEEEEIILE
jgi:hypothetical protein